MPDMGEFLKAIQIAASNTMDAAQPSDYVFGTVVSDSPLQVQISQKLILSDIQLALTRNVTKFTTKIDGTGVEIDNSLNIGDKVVLIKQKGGQQYLVIDKVVT